MSLGLAFFGFFANLVIMGWALGLVSTGAVLRWGMGAESLAWMIVFLMLPFSAVYYPVSTLPVWLQPVSLALPSTHVFEGLRGIVLEQTFKGDEMIRAALLNVVYVGAAYWLFHHLIESAREKGSLVQLGE